MDGTTVIGDAVSVLTQLQDQGVVLQTRSLQIMNIADAEKKKTFVEHWQGSPLVATTVITCMDVINQAIDEVRAVQQYSRSRLFCAHGALAVQHGHQQSVHGLCCAASRGS